jgi:hypothetical protein
VPLGRKAHACRSIGKYEIDMEEGETRRRRMRLEL